MLLFLKFIVVVVMAYFSGKLASKLKLPAILGRLIAGMLLGPYAFNVLSDSILQQSWYQAILRLFEVLLGIMLGSELVISRLKKQVSKLWLLPCGNL